jgi:outer membrane protein assembly factor BamB
MRWGGGDSPNMASAAMALPADPGTVKPLWELKLGTHQYSIPTVDRSRIYVAANDAGMVRSGYTPTDGGMLACIEQATGRLLWQLASPRFMDGVKSPYHFDQFACGICSGPLVDGDRVYVVTGRGEILCADRNGQADGNDGPFVNELEYMGIPNSPPTKLKPTDGDILWLYDMVGELDVAPHDVCGSTLLIVDDLLYACTSNGIDGMHDQVTRPDAPSLIVLDKKTGKLVARDAERIGRRLLHGAWSSPSAGRVDGRTLIFFGGADGILYAFEPPVPAADGSVRTLQKVWSYDANPPDFRMQDGKPMLYSQHNHNRPDGPSEIIGTPVFDSGRVYVAIGQSPLHGVGRGCLSCVDAATGAKVWTTEEIGRSLATVALADGLIYLPDSTGNLSCFDASSGRRQWCHPMEAKAWCASAFVADGKVYAGTAENTLWVLKAGRDLQVLSRTRLKSAMATPTAADGVLYIPTQRSLLAVPGL